jgi:hypothetical protein
VVVERYSLAGTGIVTGSRVIRSSVYRNCEWHYCDTLLQEQEI